MTVHTGARFGLSWGFAAGDSGWGASFNLQSMLLEAMLSLVLLSDSVLSPPVSPAEDDAYFVPTGATGDWIGHSGEVAAYQGGDWQFYIIPQFMRARIIDRNGFFYFNGSAWVTEVNSTVGVTSVAGHAGIVTLSVGDVAGAAPLSSPPLTGNPTTPNQAALSRNQNVANTKYVDDAVTAAGGTKVTSVNNKTGLVTLVHTDISDWSATLANYALTSSLTSYATQSYVDTRITNLINAAPTALDTLGEIATQLASDETAAGALTTLVGTKVAYAGGNMTGALNLFAGSTVSTPVATDNSTNVTNTSWVRAYLASLGLVTSGSEAVQSVAGKTGPVTLVAADIGGLGTAAAKNVADFMQPASNLSELTSLPTARTNLGLGSAATQASSAFKTAGAAESWATLPTEAQNLPIPLVIPGKPAASQVYNVVMATAITIPANFVGTMAYQGTQATAAMVVSVNKISGGALTAIGTLTLGTASKTAITLSTQAQASLGAGDVLQFAMPSVQDATGADIGITVLAAKV